jgi:hypothetical protein
MRRCGRKKGWLKVESSGCAAFGHPAATQGSLSDDHREETWAAEATRFSPAYGVTAASDQGRCPCRARLVSLAAGASRVPPAAVRWQLMRGVRNRAARDDSRQPSETTAAPARAAAPPRAEAHATTGHARTARREPISSQQHRVAERRHEPRLRIPRRPGCARWNSFACRRGPSIQPQSGRFLVAPFRIAREATMGGRAPACRQEIRQCPTKC